MENPGLYMKIYIFFLSRTEASCLGGINCTKLQLLSFTREPILPRHLTLHDT